MELSENLKLRLDHGSGETQQDRINRPIDMNRAIDNRPIDPGAGTDGGPIDEAESQMRKALGLLGEGQRHRSDPDRIDQPSRLGDRFNGGLHRRRFVQDGDIPVTVLRREQGHEAPVHRGAAPVNSPSSSRLQRTEAALAAETSAREKAERSLAETQALARDLQTKIGHAELAKNEAIEALRQEREAGAQFRSDLGQWEERLNEALAKVDHAERSRESLQTQVDEERRARGLAEKAMQAAVAARASAERLARALTEEKMMAEASRPVAETARGDAKARSQRPEPIRKAPVAAEKPRAKPEVVSVNARRQQPAAVTAAEPEPVKWWLNAKPVTKRR